MHKLNSKKFAENMRTYLLDCFESEENTEHLTPDQKFIYIYNRFTSEYVHQYNLIKYNFNETLIMKEWISGLAISCDFYYYDILQTAKKLHNLDPEYKFSEKLEDKICDNWFNLLAIHIMKNTKIALEIKVKEQENKKKELLKEKEYYTKLGLTSGTID
jgi:hypothetical protein